MNAERGLPEASPHWSPSEVLESLDSGSAPLLTAKPGVSY